MPELPEVETVRRGLVRSALGRTITEAANYREDIRFALPDGLADKLTHQAITAIERRGKYLLFTIGNGQFISHLGMSGAWYIRDASDYEPSKHEHLVWWLEDGRVMIYHDPRRFGFFIEAERGFLQHTMIQALGVEPLSKGLTAGYLHDALARKSAPIKSFLLDQAIIAGLGNIYVCEVLFRTKLHPATPANACIHKAGQLAEVIPVVLQEALDSGGSTLRDYVNAEGKSGYFQHHFDVYGREDESCTRCHSRIARMVQSGRSTFFCPSCQRSKEGKLLK